jgi:RNase H-like domain found in reverse transcriptase
MKALMVEDVLLCYPDHNLPFHICTDIPDYQLGSVILQQNAPVAFYPCKLSIHQQNYTNIEKELDSVIETFCTFRSMLLGADIHVYTDHKESFS